MDLKTPYRFQMYMPEEMRDALREVAHRKKTSMNALVYGWIAEKLQAEQQYDAPPKAKPPRPPR